MLPEITWPIMYRIPAIFIPDEFFSNPIFMKPNSKMSETIILATKIKLCTLYNELLNGVPRRKMIGNTER